MMKHKRVVLDFSHYSYGNFEFEICRSVGYKNVWGVYLTLFPGPWVDYDKDLDIQLIETDTAQEALEEATSVLDAYYDWKIKQ